jgi:molybdopterin synthase catalytic subunit/molybdopterin converting factor small subunit
MTIGVRIRLFALQRELAGTRELAVRLEAPATIADAWDALTRLHPVLAPGAASVRYARNGVYASADEGLEDGDEVAMIPPVSGGSDGSGPGDPQGEPDARPSRVLELQAEPFGADILGALASRLATRADGAVVGFLGITRTTPGTPAPGQEAEAARHAGRSVEALEYEALEPLALRVFGEIADEVRDRFGVERLAIVHRTGEVPLGEASVAIVACAAHRAAAFEAAAYAIDETKARAPIWKAERFVDGHVWIGAPAREGPRPPS